MEDDGPLQLSLFDEQDLAEITSEDFPGERLIACRNPALAGERGRKREALLAATGKLLARRFIVRPTCSARGSSLTGVSSAR